MQRQANGQQMAQPAAMQPAAQQQRNGVPNGGQGQNQVPAMASSGQNGQMHANNVQMRVPQGGLPNGMQNGAAMAARMAGMQGMPQAQQAIMAQQQQRLNSGSPEQNMNMQFMIQQQQMNRAQMQMQQLSQPGNLANAHLVGAAGLNGMNNPAMIAAMAKQMSQAQQNGGMNGAMSASSPRMGQAVPQQLSSGHVPAINQIASHISAQNPQYSPDTVNRMAAKQLMGNAMGNAMGNPMGNAYARQNALNAAAGANAAGMGNNMANMNMTMNVNNMNMGMGMNGMQMGFGNQNGSPSMANMAMNMNMGGQQGQGNVSPVQNQNYNQQLRLQQQQAMQRQMAGSPAMGMSMNGMANSRSATPQQGHQRVGSGSAMEASLSPGGQGRPGSMHGHTGSSGSVPPGSR